MYHKDPENLLRFAQEKIREAEEKCLAAKQNLKNAVKDKYDSYKTLQTIEQIVRTP